MFIGYELTLVFGAMKYFRVFSQNSCSILSGKSYGHWAVRCLIESLHCWPILDSPIPAFELKLIGEEGG